MQGKTVLWGGACFATVPSVPTKAGGEGYLTHPRSGIGLPHLHHFRPPPHTRRQRYPNLKITFLPSVHQGKSKKGVVCAPFHEALPSKLVGIKSQKSIPFCTVHIASGLPLFISWGGGVQEVRMQAPSYCQKNTQRECIDASQVVFDYGGWFCPLLMCFSPHGHLVGWDRGQGPMVHE